MKIRGYEQNQIKKWDGMIKDMPDILEQIADIINGTVNCLKNKSVIYFVDYMNKYKGK